MPGKKPNQSARVTAPKMPIQGVGSSNLANTVCRDEIVLGVASPLGAGSPPLTP
jgi:hypothetical protein